MEFPVMDRTQYLCVGLPLQYRKKSNIEQLRPVRELKSCVILLTEDNTTLGISKWNGWDLNELSISNLQDYNRRC